MADERFSIPLVMLEGNVDALLAAAEAGETIPVVGIAMRRIDHPDHRFAVVLVLKMSQEQKQEANMKYGFRTSSLKDQ